MQPKRFPTGLHISWLIVFVFMIPACERPPVEKSVTAEAIHHWEHEQPATGDHIRVTYFHYQLRCPACEIIEILARKTVERVFGDHVAQGLIQFQTLNVDTPENRIYQEQYRLTAPSVVISLYKNGKERTWRNLERVWDLYEDEKAYEHYLVENINSLLEQLDNENSG